MAGLCLIPIHIQYVSSSHASPKTVLLSVMDQIKNQYEYYTSNPNLPHLQSAQLAFNPLLAPPRFDHSAVMSNLGRIESLVDIRSPTAQNASGSPVIDILDFAVGHRLMWSRL